MAFVQRGGFSLNPRRQLGVGVALTLTGLFAALAQIRWDAFAPGHWWPLIVFAAGAGLLLSACFSRVAVLAIPGCIVTLAGMLLFLQNAAADWYSWFYTWPLVPASVGLGFMATAFLDSGFHRLAIIGRIMLGSGVAAFALFGVLVAAGWFSWPLLITATGVALLLSAAIWRVTPLVLPGVFLSLGSLLLFWQNSTGNWASSAYTWTLYLAFLALSIVLAGAVDRRYRFALKPGIWGFAASLLLYCLFCSVLTRHWAVMAVGSAGLVAIAGLVLVGTALLRP